MILPQKPAAKLFTLRNFEWTYQTYIRRCKQQMMYGIVELHSFMAQRKDENAPRNLTYDRPSKKNLYSFEREQYIPINRLSEHSIKSWLTI